MIRNAKLSGEDIEQQIRVATENERLIGVTYAYLSLNQRWFGRGYWLGAFGHPRTFQSIEYGYEDWIQYYNTEISYWKNEIEKHKFSLVIGNRPNLMAVAKSLGLQTRAWQISRRDNLAYWATDEFFFNPLLDDAFSSEPEQPGDDIVPVIEPYTFDIRYRREFLKNIKFSRTLTRIAREFVRRTYWRVRGYEKARSYLISDYLKSLFAIRRDTLRMAGAETVALDELKGRKFFFYPLHNEPEVAVQQQSPYFMAQLWAIAALARDLPADTLLAVKEAPHAVGRRQRSFYDQILSHKNVVIINMLESGIECCRQARAVATINGTPGQEAALMGKRVLMFGHYAQYDVLPNVRHVTTDKSLRSAIDWALTDVGDPSPYVAAGSRYLRAVEKVSFDLRNYDFKNYEKLDQETIDGAIDLLLRSLNQPASVAST